MDLADREVIGFRFGEIDHGSFWKFGQVVGPEGNEMTGVGW